MLVPLKALLAYKLVEKSLNDKLGKVNSFQEGDEVKFTENEITKLKEVQDGYLKVQSSFGQLSIARLNIKKQVVELNNIEEQTRKDFDDLRGKEREVVDELTKKYGQGSLDPTTGVFTPSSTTTDDNK